MSAVKPISERVFPVLETAIFERGIRKKDIAQALEISERALISKLKGNSPFTWDEVCVLQSIFPDIEKDELLSKGYKKE